MRQLSTRRGSIGWVWILPKEVATCLFKPPNSSQDFSTLKNVLVFIMVQNQLIIKVCHTFRSRSFMDRHVVNRYNFVY